VLALDVHTHTHVLISLDVLSLPPLSNILVYWCALGVLRLVA
jgi:hypothetical protein